MGVSLLGVGGGVVSGYFCFVYGSCGCFVWLLVNEDAVYRAEVRVDGSEAGGALDLSQRRARRLAEFLRGAGMPPLSVAGVGVGEGALRHTSSNVALRVLRQRYAWPTLPAVPNTACIGCWALAVGRWLPALSCVDVVVGCCFVGRRVSLFVVGGCVVLTCVRLGRSASFEALDAGAVEMFRGLFEEVAGDDSVISAEEFLEVCVNV